MPELVVVYERFDNKSNFVQKWLYSIP